MSAYLVKGQGRTCFVSIHDFAERHQPQLYKCLESVTDTAHETAPVIHKIRNRILNRRVSEESSYELARTVRLVAAGEATRNEYHLGVLESSCEGLNGSCDCICSHVSYYHNLCLGSCRLHGSGGVVLTVCSRERRNHNLRSCRGYYCLCKGFAAVILLPVCEIRYALGCRFNIARVNRFQLVLVCFKKSSEIHSFPLQGNSGIICCVSQKNAFIYIVGNFQNK